MTLLLIKENVAISDFVRLPGISTLQNCYVDFTLVHASMNSFIYDGIEREREKIFNEHILNNIVL